MQRGCHPANSSQRRSVERAFTLVEIQVTMVVILLVVGAVIAAHIFGLKMYSISRAKVMASDTARHALGELITDLRPANLVQVGKGGQFTFNPVATGVPQQGSALRVYPTTNRSAYIIYYMDEADANKLKRIASNALFPTVLAEAITNRAPFTIENSRGEILTQNQNKWVVGVNFKFFQTRPGTGAYLDFYELSAKITPRAQ